jgi:superoxide dismutase, Fe-Mn family
MQKLFKNVIFVALLAGFSSAFAQHTQAPLPYAPEALEPYIDKMTMEIHYGRHHKAYIDNLNKALAGKPEATLTIDELVRKVTKETPGAVRNNAGGHWNHTFFWNIMAPAKANNAPKGALAEAIVKEFGSLDDLKKKVKDAATGRFGSGWAWVIVKDKKLVVASTPNQDNPLMSFVESQGAPILGLDVWEHAYYLKYQNKRADYIDGFWNVVNWDKVAELYAAAIK